MKILVRFIMFTPLVLLGIWTASHSREVLEAIVTTILGIVLCTVGYAILD
jgi:hypothetical protein